MLRNWSLNPLAKAAIGILRSYGADAHVYLPGIGTVSGLTAGNYLDSTGVTAASVDNPVGLSLDGLGSVGVEKVVNGTNLVTTTGWTAGDSASLSVVEGNLRVTNGASAWGYAHQAFATVVGKSYVLAPCFVSTTASASTNVNIGISSGGNGVAGSVDTSKQKIFVAIGALTYISLYANDGVAGHYTDFGNISVREIHGIHATQSTTANKALLKSAAGKYSWQFDGSNDSLLTGNLGITNTVTVVIAGVLNTLPAFSVMLGEATGGVSFYVAGNGVLWADKEGSGAIVSAPIGTIVAGVPFVATFRLQAGASVLRKNGTQIATAASAQTFVATTGARIGTAFNGTSYPCNGSIFAVQVITATTTDSGLLTLERLAAQMAGVSI